MRLTTPLLALLPVIALTSACAPSDDELRAIGEARMGRPGRSVAIGFVVAERSARDCCCGVDEKWYDLAQRPATCELYPNAAEGERYFRGSSFLDAACLSGQGYLEPRTVQRAVVSCAAVSCEPGAPAPAEAPASEAVQVFVETEALKALEKPGGTLASSEYYVGYDRLGEIHTQERTGLSTISANMQLKEEQTALDACVIERRSRQPSNNRKLDFEFRREEGTWR